METIVDTPENPPDSSADNQAALNNASFKDLVQHEALNLKGRIALKLAGLQDAAAMFVGARVAPHLPKACLVLAVIAVGIGIPVALPGLLARALLMVLPLAALAILVGLVSAQSKLSHLGMLLSIVAVLETISASIYFNHERQVKKNEAEAAAQEEVRRQDEKIAKSKKEADEDAKRIKAEEQARIAAEEKAKKEKDEAELKTYRENEAKKAEIARKDKEKRDAEIAAARKKAEEEAKRKAAEDLQNAAANIDKSAALGTAKEDYRTKVMKVDDLTEALTKLEQEAKVAKDEAERKATFLARRDSPNPPSDEDLAKAQKAYDQWKKDSDRLQAQLPVMRADLEKATKDKEAAGKVLDALQKP